MAYTFVYLGYRVHTVLLLFAKASMSRWFLWIVLSVIVVVVLWFVWWSTDLFGYYEKQDISHFHYLVTQNSIDISIVRIPDKSLESIQLEVMYDESYVDLLTRDISTSSDTSYSLASQAWILTISLSQIKKNEKISFSVPFVSRSIDNPIILSEAVFGFLDGSKLYGSIRRL